tara:strand:+ start:169 stop:369 length:201 start_codon:yes stop_codon:yes gene_type:complete
VQADQADGPNLKLFFWFGVLLADLLFHCWQNGDCADQKKKTGMERWKVELQDVFYTRMGVFFYVHN